MTEGEVLIKLAGYRDHKQRYEVMIPNAYVQKDSEADLFCIRRSGLCDEFEVKTSRSDFLADKNKFVRWRDLNRGEQANFKWEERASSPCYKLKSDALKDGDMCVNYFWYAVLDGVAIESDIPDYAGLVIISEGGSIRVVKHPKKLNKNKLSLEQRYNFSKKLHYRFWKSVGVNV